MTKFLKTGLSRRRFLSISAAAGVCSAGSVSAGTLARWTGRVMGAHASMQLAGVSEHDARPIFLAVERELVRLESIFSLYQPQSQLVRLNTKGALTNPAPELLDVLSLCSQLHQATGGAFDPTIQPLWFAHAEAATHGRSLGPKEDQAMRALIGWDRVRFDAGEARFLEREMALTLNGVAQGFVTDKISVLLKQMGVRDVVIDMGEIAAQGRRPDGETWTAGIATPDGNTVKRVVLKDRALATSAPSGTVLNAESDTLHILDPRGDARLPMHSLVSVSSQRAAVADGLSTAGCLMDHAELAVAIGTFPNTTLENVS